MFNAIKDPLPEIDLERVAYQLARHIADGHIRGDRELQKLDAVGRMTAAHTMALRMAPDLKGECEVVLDEVRRQLLFLEWWQVQACLEDQPQQQAGTNFELVAQAQQKQAAYELHRAMYREANPIREASSDTRAVK